MLVVIATVYILLNEKIPVLPEQYEDKNLLFNFTWVIIFFRALFFHFF